MSFSYLNVNFYKFMSVNKIFGFIAGISTASFGWIFWFKHLPLVGWNYVLQHWVFYALMIVAGTSIMGIFFGMAKVCETLSTQCDDNEL